MSRLVEILLTLLAGTPCEVCGERRRGAARAAHLWLDHGDEVER